MKKKYPIVVREFFDISYHHPSLRHDRSILKATSFAQNSIIKEFFGPVHSPHGMVIGNSCGLSPWLGSWVVTYITMVSSSMIVFHLVLHFQLQYSLQVERCVYHPRNLFWFYTMPESSIDWLPTVASYWLHVFSSLCELLPPSSNRKGVS